MKKQLAQPETLGYFDPSAQTIVVTDASSVGLGGVLVQKQGSEYKVIMYASRCLFDVERRKRRTHWESSADVKGSICISQDFNSLSVFSHQSPSRAPGLNDGFFVYNHLTM